jgi:hypothetical protein
MIGLIVLLVVVGILLWAVESLIPMDATIKRLIQVVVVLFVLLFILRYFGLF